MIVYPSPFFFFVFQRWSILLDSSIFHWYFLSLSLFIPICTFFNPSLRFEKKAFNFFLGTKDLTWGSFRFCVWLFWVCTKNGFFFIGKLNLGFKHPAIIWTLSFNQVYLVFKNFPISVMVDSFQKSFLIFSLSKCQDIFTPVWFRLPLFHACLIFF